MSEVRIWEEDVTIPTYETGKPDKNPMFLEKRVYQGSSGKLYPYPTTEEISFTRKDKVWHAVWLENDYLKVMVLPELGGRIQRALDKTNQYDFVYYNHVIKPALVGLAGPWISGGIEFNWPQHHRPTTYLPVDHMITRHEDGSMTLLCNDIDQMYGTKGITSFTLYPDKAYIEIKGQLYNRTNLPQTFLWWANPAVPVNDNTQSVFPTDVHFVMDHGKRDVSRFPIARGVYYKHDYSEGVDISRYKNIPVPTSYMAEKSDYDFVGGYDYGVEAGLLHVADHHVSPGKKQWTWGCGDFGKAWDRNLTDADGPYIELMCGVFTDNQPDFSWLKPFEEKTFTQYFMPYKKVGQVKNATIDAAVNLELVTPEDRRDAASAKEAGAHQGEAGCQAHIIVYATALHPAAGIELYVRGKLVYDTQAELSPVKVFEKCVEVDARKETELRIVVRDGDQVLVEYQPKEQGIPEMAKPAAAAKKPEEILTNEELFLTAEHIEQYRHATFLPDPYYLEALKRDPGDMRVNNAYGLLLMRRGNFEAAVPYFEASIRRSTMMTPNPYHSEAMYNLGVCLLYLGREAEAYDRFYKACWSNEMQEMGFYYLAVIAARRGEFHAALDFCEKSLVKNAHNVKARGLKAAVLGKLGENEKALDMIASSLELDPFDYVSRFIGYKITHEKACLEQMTAFMRGFAGNYLAAARDFLEAGMAQEALELLKLYEGEHPLVDYYRGFALRKLEMEGQTSYLERKGKAGTAVLQTDEETAGAGALAAYEKAEIDDAAYCFPNKLEDILVLEDAISVLSKQGKGCARACYYLGCLFYDKLQYEKAAHLWERSAKIDGSFPTVHRNLALVYYNKMNRTKDALAEMELAFSLDEGDARVFLELDQLYKKAGISIEERLAHFSGHEELSMKRDDLLVEELTMRNTAGQYETVYDRIMGHRFRPWEGGEGKVPMQYKTSLVQMAVRSLKAGDAKAAKEKLEQALLYPENLGEGRLEGTKDNHIWYWLGRTLEALGDAHEAKKAYEKAELGQDEPAGAMYYYDQPADMILFKGLAKRRLGKEKEACMCFNKLMDYGERHVNDVMEYDYFAVSMPDFLIFDTDLTKKNTAHCWYLMGLAGIGSGDTQKAEECFRKALEYEYDHQNAILYARMLKEGLFLEEK
ncbi:MAG TPA: DUF5107 domain-containing protein [Lachnospiraceae bacterium]|nr:DUF5107 domain-containing protein [Lachnospiraceae bacterium]